MWYIECEINVECKYAKYKELNIKYRIKKMGNINL